MSLVIEEQELNQLPVTIDGTVEYVSFGTHKCSRSDEQYQCEGIVQKTFVQQGHRHFDARSVHRVREHGTMLRTPLAAFFNIPLIKILSRIQVFQGTRIPVDTLISNHEAGLTVDEILENFPSVSREQALQVLEFPNPLF